MTPMSRPGDEQGSQPEQRLTRGRQDRDKRDRDKQDSTEQDSTEQDSGKSVIAKPDPAHIAAGQSAAEAALANALRDSLLAVTSLPSVDEIMEQILDSVRSVIPYEGATIMLFEGDQARVVSARGFDENVKSSVLQALIPATKTHFVQLLETGAPYIVDDTRLDPNWIDIPGTDWIRSSLGTPITVHDRLIGLIAIDSSAPHRFTTDDAARMQLFARYVGLAINNAYQNELLSRLVAERTAELQAAKETLEAREAMLRSAQRIANLGSWHINMTTGEQHWSDEMFAISGFDPAAGIPDLQTITRCVHAKDQARIETLVQTMTTSGGAVEDEITFMRVNDNAERRVLVRCEQVGAPGAVTFVQGIVLDITEQKAAEDALRTALEREKEISALKSRFAAMASHEFRTPLSVILANVELLKAGWRANAPEKIDSRLDSIIYQAKLLNDILGRLLELSQLQAGAVKFDPVRLDLVNVCQEALVQLRRTTVPPAVFVLDAPSSPVWMTGDPVYVHRIVSNIIGNAQKYSPAGTPVHIMVGAQGNEVYLSVTDQGIGIPPADLANIFEPFYRGANVAGISGSGLGMALVKLLVNLHQGRIHVTSEVGRGTCVTVHLPRHETKPAPVSAPATSTVE